MLKTPIFIFDLEAQKLWWTNQAGTTLFEDQPLESLLEQDWVLSESSLLFLQQHQKALGEGETLSSIWPFSGPHGDGFPEMRQCLLSACRLEKGAMAMLVEVMPNSTHICKTQRLEEELAEFMMKEQKYRAELNHKNEKLKSEMLERERAQQFLQLIMDNIPQAIFWKDCDLNYLGCNKIFLENAGCETPQDIIGKSDYDLPWTQEESDWFRGCDRRIIKTNTPQYHIIEPQLRADGEQTWLDTNKIPLHDETGKAIGILGTYEDITARRKVEISLEHQIQREQLLRELTQEIRGSLDSQQIFQTAVNRIGQAFNISRCHIHSYQKNEIHPLPIVAEYVTPGCDSMLGLNVQLSDHCSQVLSQDKAIASDNVYEDLIVKQSIYDESPFYLNSMLSVRTSYRGQANGAIVLHHCDRPLTRQELSALPESEQQKLFRQWTVEEVELLEAVAEQVGIALAQARMLEIEKRQRHELVRKNNELLQAMTLAKQANHAKTVFLSSMSHELRTPLNGILGYAQLLQQAPDLPPSSVKKVEGIHECGTDLLKLIEDLMDLSIVDVQTLKLQPLDLSFPNFLKSLDRLFMAQAQQSGLQFDSEFHPDLPAMIHTDEQRLHQVLSNVVMDTLKHIKKGGVTFRVNPLNSSPEMKSEILDDKNSPYDHSMRIQFQVASNNHDHSLEELSKVFLPAAQVGDVSRSHAGIGLGLAISRKITTLMGGKIQYVNSSEGESCLSIIFEFPVVPRHQLSEESLSKTIENVSPLVDAEDSPNMVLPSLDVLKRLFSLAKRGLIYDLRDLIESMAEADCNLLPFCQQMLKLIEQYRIKQIQMLLRDALQNMNSSSIATKMTR